MEEAAALCINVQHPQVELLLPGASRCVEGAGCNNHASLLSANALPYQFPVPFSGMPLFSNEVVTVADVLIHLHAC
jgi:hypothetical protein